MIKAEIVADSKNEYGNRLTTFVITFPRIILAEFNTHRMLSKNTASSRAIPFDKLVKMVEENPFVPIAWQKDHKGMQGTEYHTDSDDIKILKENWDQAKSYALYYAKNISFNQVTKQICNRLLEPFMWCTMIVSGTEWENFFHLRCPRYEVKAINRMNVHSYDPVSGSLAGVYDDIQVRHYRSRKDFLKENSFSGDPMTDLQWMQINTGQAEIHMMALAEAMWDAYNESTPKQLKAGEWHIPYEDRMDKFEIQKISPVHFAPVPNDIPVAVKVATVMAARTSYTVVGEDQKPMSYAKMIELHDKLKSADPIHASPFEHCGQAMGEDYLNNNSGYPISTDMATSGNFRGFKQYRK